MPVQSIRRSKAAGDIGIGQLARKAGEAARLLKLLANESRLLILCRLVIAGEMSVGDSRMPWSSASRPSPNTWPGCAKTVSLPGGAKHKPHFTSFPIRAPNACLRCSRTSTAVTGQPQQKGQAPWLIYKPSRQLAPLSLSCSRFYVLSGFVGTGLILAGATGFCGMARLLALMPWNRREGFPVQ